MDAPKALNKKEIRYAVIKGTAERRNYLLKPLYLQSLEQRNLLEVYIDNVLSFTRYLGDTTNELD